MSMRGWSITAISAAITSHEARTVMSIPAIWPSLSVPGWTAAGAGGGVGGGSTLSTLPRRPLTSDRFATRAEVGQYVGAVA
jgi:hypothetical protein